MTAKCETCGTACRVERGEDGVYHFFVECEHIEGPIMVASDEQAVVQPPAVKFEKARTPAPWRF